jgi:hypothetical protein
MEGVMKQASFLDTVKTVLWAMIGIRKRSAHDEANIRPTHVIIVAVIFVIVFILTLRFIVGVIVS